MNIRLGVSPSSWGIWFAEDPLQIPWQQFLDQVVIAGYERVELGPWGYLPTDISTLDRELKRRNLKLTAGFLRSNLADSATRPALMDQVRTTGGLLQGVGARHLILMEEMYQDLRTGAQTRPPSLNADEWKVAAERLEQIADLLRAEFDLGLLFEPHTASRIEYTDQIETLLSNTDPARVALLLDIGHFAFRNGDPVPFIRRHHARIPYLHLKSIDPQVQRQVVGANVPFPQAVGMGLFCEPALGKVDFDSLFQTLREVQFDGWAIVEQGMYPAPFDKPLPIAKRTRAYLHDKGWG